MAPKRTGPARSRSRGVKKSRPVAGRRVAVRVKPKRSPARPPQVADVEVIPQQAAPENNAELQPGGARWTAYEDIVHKLESTFDVRIDDIHRRLDKQGLRGHRFSDLLDAVITLTGIPAFYAGMVVRSYPGYETDDSDATSLRAFLKARRNP